MGQRKAITPFFAAGMVLPCKQIMSTQLFINAAGEQIAVYTIGIKNDFVLNHTQENKWLKARSILSLLQVEQENQA